MDKFITDKILNAQVRFYSDPEYSRLWAELQAHDRDFLHLRKELNPWQCAVLDDYMGCLHELQLKLLYYVAKE